MKDYRQFMNTGTYRVIENVMLSVGRIICAILSVAAIITQKGFWVFLGVLGLIVEIIFVIGVVINVYFELEDEDEEEP